MSNGTNNTATVKIKLESSNADFNLLGPSEPNRINLFSNSPNFAKPSPFLQIKPAPTLAPTDEVERDKKTFEVIKNYSIYAGSSLNPALRNSHLQSINNDVPTYLRSVALIAYNAGEDLARKFADTLKYAPKLPVEGALNRTTVQEYKLWAERASKQTGLDYNLVYYGGIVASGREIKSGHAQSIVSYDKLIAPIGEKIITASKAKALEDENNAKLLAESKANAEKLAKIDKALAEASTEKIANLEKQLAEAEKSLAKILATPIPQSGKVGTTQAPTVAAPVINAPTAAAAAATQTKTANSNPATVINIDPSVVLRIPEDRKQFVLDKYGKDILNKAYDYSSRQHLGFAGGAEKYLASQPANERELIQKASVALKSGHIAKEDAADAVEVRDRTRIVIGNKSEREKFIKGAFGDESKVIFNLIKDMPRAGSDMKGAERLIKKAETPEERLDKNLDKLFSSRLASAKTDVEKQTIQEEKGALKAKVEVVKKFMADGQIDSDIFPKYQAWMTSRYPNSAATLAQPVVEKPAGNDVVLQTTYKVKRSGFLGIFGEKKVHRKVEVVDSFAE